MLKTFAQNIRSNNASNTGWRRWFGDPVASWTSAAVLAVPLPLIVGMTQYALLSPENDLHPLLVAPFVLIGSSLALLFVSIVPPFQIILTPVVILVLLRAAVLRQHRERKQWIALFVLPVSAAMAVALWAIGIEANADSGGYMNYDLLLGLGTLPFMMVAIASLISALDENRHRGNQPAAKSDDVLPLREESRE